MNNGKMSKSSRLKRLKSIAWSICRAFLLIGLAYIVLYTIVYIIVVSVRAPEEMMNPAVVWITRTFTLDNIKYAIEFMEYWVSLGRTALVSVVCTLLQCISCAFAGYGFARFKFKGRNVLFACAIMTLLVPTQITMLPQFINYVRAENATGIIMIDTPIPLMANAVMGMGLRSGLFIYLFRQFFKNMPKELEEAAYIDGCSPMAAFFRVIFGNARSIFLVVFVLSIVWYWNDYYTVSMFYSSAHPLSITLQNLHSVLNMSRNAEGLPFTATENAVIMKSGALLFLLPILLLYSVLQKRFTQSITDSAIVG